MLETPFYGVQEHAHGSTTNLAIWFSHHRGHFVRRQLRLVGDLRKLTVRVPRKTAAHNLSRCESVWTQRVWRRLFVDNWDSV